MFTLLYWVFCFSFALDFRGSQGGNPIQYLYLAVALGSAAVMIMATPKAFASKPVAIMTVLWWVYLGSTIVVMVEAGVPPSQYARCVLPPLLCGMGMVIGQALAVRGYPPEALIRPLLWAGIISVFWRFIYAIVISKIPISEVRYELLSPALPLLFAASVASAILGRRLDALSIWGGALGIASVMVSVTRSFLFTLAAACVAVGAAFMIMILSRALSPQDLARKMRHFVVGGLVVVVVFAFMFLANPMVFDRWVERLFNDGGGRTKQQVTYLTRAAEAKAMWELLEEDPLRFAYGKGMGATYFWHQSYFPELLLVYSKPEEINEDQWYPGHSVWTYALFTGGVFAVICYIFLFGWMIFVGISGARRALQHGGYAPEIAFLPMIAGFCFFSQTLTANPFGERFSAQIMGLCAALPQFYYLMPAMVALPSRSRSTYGPKTPLPCPTARS